jgi:hypothetical protein
MDSPTMHPLSVLRCVLKELEAAKIELSTGTMNRLRQLVKRGTPPEKKLPCGCWTAHEHEMGCPGAQERLDG